MIVILCLVIVFLNRFFVLYCDLKVVCKDFEFVIENYFFCVWVIGVIIKIVNVVMLGMDFNVNIINFM